MRSINPLIRRIWPLMALFAAVLAKPAYAVDAEAAINSFKHLGAASCSSNVCHGKLNPQPGKDVALNEYRIWSQEDRHAQAYRTLETEESRRIAAKLGLPSATTAKICLDCHADNIPSERRGPKFQLSDGVGCEACHGGSEKWIDSHAAEQATHKDNLAKGMYPSETPVMRASLCLTCHLGTKDKFATHVIMGAGHPRLSFELEAFTSNQPSHFTVDADYVERKGKIEGANLWITGQIENARRYLALLQGPRFQGGGIFPELAFYDCHSCHHPFEDKRWTAQRAGPGIKPGTLRLQTQNFMTLQVVAEVLGSGAGELSEARAQLVRAGQSDVAALRVASSRLLNWVTSRESLSTRKFSPAEVAKIRRTLLNYASNDKASDFGAAEQVVLGVESLSYSLGDRDKRKGALDALYNAVKSDKNFSPSKFADVAKSVQGQF
jgi:hypothetical protein